MGDSPYLVALPASAAAGLTAGWIMHRSDFCVAAMFRDLFLIRDFYLLRILLVLVFASMLLFELVRLAGATVPFPLLPKPSLGAVFAGMLFGIGMVLAGGCAVGTLYKMGAGSFPSLAAFVGMITGATLYAELYPAWAGVSAILALGDGRTIPEALGLAPSVLVVPLALLSLLLLFRAWKRGALTRDAFTRGHLAPWRAALLLALLGGLSLVLVGMPFGLTTAFAKLGAMVETLIAPLHAAGLDYFRTLPLEYQPPFSPVVVTGGPGPALDAVAAVQFPLIVGIVLGAAASALRLGEWRFQPRVPRAQLMSALVGGLLLGLAARMGAGCNVWHLWGGLPVLASQSLLFVAGLFPGAWLGTRLLTRFVIHARDST